MTEQRKPQDHTDGLPTASDVWGTLTALVIHSEQVRWMRVNTLLVVDSIFVAVWAGVFVGTECFDGKAILLAAICLPGILLGIPFACLGWRSSQYMDDFHKLAEGMNTPEGTPHPFCRSEARRRSVRRGFGRVTSSRSLVVALPLMFVLLFVGLGVASFVMGP